jgi:error-prone DNA polymerase
MANSLEGRGRNMTDAELAVTTNFSCLTGASHPEEMVERAAGLGLAAVAITDRNTLAGVVRAHTRLREMRREATRIKPPNVTAEDVRERARIRSQSRTDPSSRLSEEELRARFSQAEPVPAAPEPARYAALPKLIPKLIVGTRLVFTDTAIEVIALAPDRRAYAGLCRLLTLGKHLAE